VEFHELPTSTVAVLPVSRQIAMPFGRKDQVVKIILDTRVVVAEFYANKV
jgi:hypothetical protein